VDDLLDRIDAYCDAVPRSAARAEQIGPFVLFVPGPHPWPYYARPARGHADPATAEDVRRVRDRQRELGEPEAFEWIADVAPGLIEVARAGGLEVNEHPLMVLEDPVPAPVDGVELRLVTPDDDLALLGAVLEVGFSNPGTARGAAGLTELEERAQTSTHRSIEFRRDRVRRGLTVWAAVWVDGRPVAGGMHQPVGAVTEIVGVTTLPAFRRRGLGAAVTALLVEDARARGTETVFLTAGDEEIARVYARLGFVRVGTSCIAAAE
jgi:ribosomal protein S18 acetylase RimI-like enzyme